MWKPLRHHVPSLGAAPTTRYCIFGHRTALSSIPLQASTRTSFLYTSGDHGGPEDLYAMIRGFLFDKREGIRMLSKNHAHINYTPPSD